MQTIKNHILLRGSTYHVRLDIPAALRAAYGNRRVLSKSLKTGDALLARELAAAQIAAWKAGFRQFKDEQIRRGDDWQEHIAKHGRALDISRRRQLLAAVDDSTPARTEAEADAILQAMQKFLAESEAEQLAAGIPQEQIDRANELLRLKLTTAGVDRVAHIKQLNELSRRTMVAYAAQDNVLSPEEQAEALTLISSPNGFKPKSPFTKSLQQRFDVHLSTQSDNERTRSVALSKIATFSDWLTAEGHQLTFDSVAQFLDTLGSNRQTRQGYLWALRKLHKWAVRYEQHYRQQFADKPSPFDGHTHPRVGKGSGGSWAAFSRKEAERLHCAAMAKQDNDLADLIAFACWTGGRIEELGRISTSTTVFDDLGEPAAFRVEDAKTKAGVREIPIASKLAPLYKQRLSHAQAQGGYLFSGNNKTKSGIRLNALSQRFTKLKRAEGFSDKHVFHSFRKLTATQLEQAGAPALVVPSILGHIRGSLTFDLYSAGASLEQKKAAIELLAFDFG
ncbi:tyrosine-type recombinase/integrase [Pseudomonas sp. NPDC077408]